MEDVTFEKLKVIGKVVAEALKTEKIVFLKFERDGDEVNINRIDGALATALNNILNAITTDN